MFFMLNWVTGRCICMEYNPYYLSSPLDHASASLQADAAPTEGMKEEGSPTDIKEAAHTAVFLIISESLSIYIEKRKCMEPWRGPFCAVYSSVNLQKLVELENSWDFLALCTVV